MSLMNPTLKFVLHSLSISKKENNNYYYVQTQEVSRIAEFKAKKE